MTDQNLADFITSISGKDQLAVEENLGDGFVRLRTAEAERRQAKHDIRSVEDIVIEMLRNARDAHAKKIYLAISRDGSSKTLTFLDDGDGVPKHMHEAVFEPRVTSKLESMVMDRWGVHGRGMALYSIRSNTSSSRVVTSQEGLGSSFEVIVNLDELPEKADQSTFPKLIRQEDGTLEVGRGPHNVIRTTIEFALESKEKLTVYLGNPTEIAAVMVQEGRKKLSDEQMLFCDDISALPVCLRPAASSDALELVDTCKEIGIPISERTAHRIMANQIEIIKPALNKIVPEKSTKTNVADLSSDKRGLKVAAQDMDKFERALNSAFSNLANQYFLTCTDSPKVHIGKDCITVKFNFEKEL